MLKLPPQRVAGKPRSDDITIGNIYSIYRVSKEINKIRYYFSHSIDLKQTNKRRLLLFIYYIQTIF